MPLVFTTQMKKRLTPRVMQMLETSLREFPELEGKTLTVGYTRSYLGAAFTADTPYIGTDQNRAFFTD